MAFHNNQDVVNQVIQEVAGTAPQGWRKIIFYYELLEDANIGLRSKFTARCFGGDAFEVRLDTYNIGRSMKVIDGLKALYHDSAKDGDRWTGILLTIFSTGQFRCRFYYGKTPLLDNDRAEMEKLISEGMGDLPGN